jgi:hypothetical protein
METRTRGQTDLAGDTTMTVEMISAISTGAIGLMTALAALLANRSRRRSEDTRATRRLYRDLQRKYHAAMGHVFLLEQKLVQARKPVPPRPEILESDDDDDGPPPTPVRANASA